MFAFTTLAIAALAAVGAQALGISTPPSLTLCQKATYEVTGNTPGEVLYAVVVKASDPCGDPLKEFEVLGTFEWTVDLPAGETVMLAIENTDGEEAWSGAIKIEDGDDSCLSTASSSTSSSAPRSSTPVNAPVNAGESPESTSGASRPAFGAAVAGIAATIVALAF